MTIPLGRSLSMIDEETGLAVGSLRISRDGEQSDLCVHGQDAFHVCAETCGVGNAVITAMMHLPTLPFGSTTFRRIKTANGWQPGNYCPGGTSCAKKESPLGNCARTHAITVALDRSCDAGASRRGIRFGGLVYCIVAAFSHCRLRLYSISP
jgi:hypothetical protein